MVDIERFALVLAWFGPIGPMNGVSNGFLPAFLTLSSGEKRSVTFLDRILAIMRFGWFFGDMEREECEALLLDLKKKAGLRPSQPIHFSPNLFLGTFLVRVNLGGSVGPEVSPFTISKVNRSGNVEHHRVYPLKNHSGLLPDISN